MRFSPAGTLGLAAGQYAVSDVLSGEQLGLVTASQQLSLLVNPMGVRLLRFNLVSLAGAGKGGTDTVAVAVTNPGTSGWCPRSSLSLSDHFNPME